MKKFNITCALISSISAAYAGAPLTLSGPSPAISSTVTAGYPVSYTYTITNHTHQTIPVSQTISGNSVANVTISTPCTSVPAAGNCSFVVTMRPVALDYLLSNGIQDTVSVNYSGRLPAKISSSINTTVEIPALNSLTVTSSANAYSLIPTTLGNGFVTYTATATTTTGVLLDVTPVVTWTSSNTHAASAPNTSGQATTYFVGGSANDPSNQTTITATFANAAGSGPVSDSSILQVNDMLYQSIPYGGTGGYPYSSHSPAFYDILSASTGAPSGTGTSGMSGVLLMTNYYSNIIYTTISSDARFIYMSNDSNVIYACGIDASTGNSNSSTTCTQITLASSSSTNDIGTLKLSPNNQFLYALTASGVYACQANQITGAISGCVLQKTNANTTNGNINSFAIDPNGEYMYLVSKAGVSPYMQTCSINQDTGTLSSCVNQSPVGINTALTSDDLAAVTTANGTYIYGSSFVSGGSWDGEILACLADPSTGTVSTCSYPAVTGTLDNPTGISVASTSSGPAWLYWADGQGGQIHYCKITDYTTFSNCSSISTGANNAGILVR